MGTYLPMSSNQRDAATMLYLKDPLPSSHSETPILTGNTIMYMNFPSSSVPYSDALTGNSQSHSSCVNVPSVTSDSNTSQQEVLLNFGGARALDNQLNAWKDGRNEMIMMHQPGGASCVLQGASNLQGQGLSLSLSTNVPSVLNMSHIQYQNENTDFSSILGPNALIPGEDRARNMSFENEDGFQTKQSRDNDYVLHSVPGSNSNAANDIPPYGVPGIARTVPNSKYLKAAQELLDEVVNVKKAIKDKKAKRELKDTKEAEGEYGDGASDPSAATASSLTQKANGNAPTELSVAEKQELQNKLTKLLSMLDEVDRRYRQYYHQMQIVVSSFDVIAGSGAAKPYTALALQTISRHFRCLRDAINGQIHAARKSLGEEDASSNDKGVGISRLRYVDQQLRQQRALQQLGMMQQHAWRPQRGLPETSVSILRAWLFEHFLHPYPKDSEKIMLARQTGLTRSQVSNWFINARVRLWKPMVEEMYKEELGDADMDSNSSSETATGAAKIGAKASEDKAEGTTSTGQLLESKSDQMNDVEMMGSDANSIFQSDYGIGRTREGQKQTTDSSLFPDAVVESNCGSDRFIAAAAAAYHMSELERYGNIGGVSLTLGLQQCEGGSMAMADSTQNAFIPLRETDAYNTTASAMGTETAEFDCMDAGNRPHRLVSSLLPSFT